MAIRRLIFALCLMLYSFIQVDAFMADLPVDIRPDVDNQHEWNKKQMQQMPQHDDNVLGVGGPSKERQEFVKNREKSYCEGSVHEVKKQVSQ